MNISVIIPSFKPQEYLYTCLKSLEQQVFEKSDFEVVVVLNGCKEPFYSRIRSFIQKSMLNVNLIQTDEAGVSNARNIALDCVKGKYVTFLDDDDLIEPTFLECGYWTLETNKKASWAYSDSVGFGTQEYVWNKYFDSDKKTHEDDV